MFCTISGLEDLNGEGRHSPAVEDRAGRRLEIVRATLLRQSEVGCKQFSQRGVLTDDDAIVVTEHDVVGLEVAVHDALLLVQISKGEDQL